VASRSDHDHDWNALPVDHVNRQSGPRTNALWLSDFTYVATWAGFVYVAFVIDAYAAYVSWRVQEQRTRASCRRWNRLCMTGALHHGGLASQ
jgi:transposase InsO family protein